jgi:hypothetical protein
VFSGKKEPKTVADDGVMNSQNMKLYKAKTPTNNITTMSVLEEKRKNY